MKPVVKIPLKLTKFNFKLDLFRQCLGAFLLVTLIPMTMLAVTLGTSVHNNLESAAEKSMELELERLSVQIVNFTEATFPLLVTTALRPDLIDLARGPAQDGELAAIQKANPDFVLVQTIGPDGIAVGRSDFGKRIDYKDRIYFKDAMQGKLGAQSLISKTTGKPAFTASAPMRKDGQIVGILSTVLELDKVRSFVNNHKVGETGFAWMVDKDNKILFHPTDALMRQRTDMSNDDMVKFGRMGKNPPKVFSKGGKQWLTATAQLPHGWLLVTQMETSEAYAGVRSFDRLFTAIAFLTLILVLALAWSFSRYLSAPIQEMARNVRFLAQGDLDHPLKISRGGEIGEIATSLQDLIAYLKEVATVAEGMSQGHLDRTVVPKGSTDQLGVPIARMVENLREIVTRVSGSAHSVASAAMQSGAAVLETSSAMEEMAASIQHVASNADTLASAVGQTSSSIEQMTVSIKQVASNVQAVSGATGQAADRASGGRTAVEQTIDAMNRINTVMGQVVHVIDGLGKSSNEIGDIVSLIEDIAEQTNLLALNAAIEAARAGEHGRGFAVVADEVRKLAERSAKATKDIAALIKSIQKETGKAILSTKQGEQEIQDGTRIANGAGEALSEIVDAVGSVSELMNRIALATVEQEQTSRQITDATISMNQMTHQVARATREQQKSGDQVVVALDQINRMSADLQRQADGLLMDIAFFKQGRATMLMTDAKFNTEKHRAMVQAQAAAGGVAPDGSA